MFRFCKLLEPTELAPPKVYYGTAQPNKATPSKLEYEEEKQK